MKSTKDTPAPASPGLSVIAEMEGIERDFLAAVEAKKAQLQITRQELIAKIKQVDQYLGTDTFGAGKAAGDSGRLPKGELERYIREALARGPAPIGELLRRMREAGLTGKDASIRSKMGNKKWTGANGIVKNGSAFALKK